MKTPVAIALFAAAAVAAFGAGIYAYRHAGAPQVNLINTQAQSGTQVSAAAGSQVSNAPLPVGQGTFSLTDDEGRPVTQANLKDGRYHLVFFGFTHCPDMCPGMLTTVAGIYEKMPLAQQQRIQMVFVSVDPNRDNQQKLHDFVRGFNPSFVGWRGSQAQVDAMTKDYLAYGVRRPDDHAPDGYTMDHSTLLYLMGPDGQYVTHFRNSDSATSIAERLNTILGSSS